MTHNENGHNESTPKNRTSTDNIETSPIDGNNFHQKQVAQKSIKLNVIMNGLYMISGIIFQLVTYPYISRILNPEGIGSIDFSQTYISYFSMVALLGIPVYGIRACAVVRDDKEKLSKTVQELLIIALLMMIFSYSALSISFFFVKKIRIEFLLTITFSATIFLNSISMNWLYSALEEYAYIAIRSISLNVVAIIAMFLFVKTSQDYIVYAIITVCASAGSSILNLFHSRKYIIFKKPKKYDFKQHIKPVLSFFAITAIISIYTNLDKLLLGFLIDDDNLSVGLYSTVNRIYRGLIVIVSILGTVLLPRMSYYYKNNQKDKYFLLISKAVNFVLVFAIPLILFFSFNASTIVLLYAGEEFSKSTNTLLILLPGILLAGLNNITGNQILITMQKERILIISVIVGAIVDFALNLILIPKFTYVAPAIATICAELVILTVQVIYLKKYWKVLSSGIHLVKLLVLNVSLVIVLLGVSFIPVSQIWQLFLNAGLFGIVYFAILMLFKEPMLLDILKWKRSKTNSVSSTTNDKEA
ncbi:MAG: flippase [Christensenellaceae bacterium]|jgi:O-antigen/teichoic acid export membrane protein|nr:flippase [Christensenellaceae bacterium]